MSENLLARISRSCGCLQMDFLRGEKAARLASQGGSKVTLPASVRKIGTCVCV